MSTLSGHIDSLVLEITDTTLKKLSQIAVITVAKNGIVLDGDLLHYFKLKKPQLYDYLAIAETQTGLRYQLIKHTRAKSITLTFRGLYQYTDTSRLMRYDLKAIEELLSDDCTYARLDIAFDKDKPFDVERIARNINRVTRRFKNTIYLKSAKEKKTNQHLNIKHYKKGENVYRLEFVFLKRYLSGSDEVIKNRLTKVVKKALKQSFKFESFFA